MSSRDAARPAEPWWRRCRRLGTAEEGAQAIEVMLIFGLVVIPCFGAVLLLQEVLCEYLEVETTILTSPFF